MNYQSKIIINTSKNVSSSHSYIDNIFPYISYISSVYNDKYIGVSNLKSCCITGSVAFGLYGDNNGSFDDVYPFRLSQFINIGGFHIDDGNTFEL